MTPGDLTRLARPAMAVSEIPLEQQTARRSRAGPSRFLVDLTFMHKNPPVLVDGPEISVKLVEARRTR